MVVTSHFLNEDVVERVECPDLCVYRRPRSFNLRIHRPDRCAKSQISYRLGPIAASDPDIALVDLARSSSTAGKSGDI